MDISQFLIERRLKQEEWARNRYEERTKHAVNPVSYEEWSMMDEGESVERFPLNPFPRLTRKQRRALAKGEN